MAKFEKNDKGPKSLPDILVLPDTDLEPAAVEPTSTTVKLQNRTRSLLTFNLPHLKCCETRCLCQPVTRLETKYDYRNEESVHMMVDRLICSSITLLAGEAADFDIGVLKSPDLDRAISRGDLIKV